MQPIYTLDIETDPFAHGVIPKPFAIGFYDGETFTHFWGAGCIQKMRDHVESLPAGIIYLHNGGKFDLYYLLDWLTGDTKIINGRIVLSHMRAVKGLHELRDSYAIMPFKLKQYKKDDIDYNLLKRECRDANRDEIVSYLKGDCVYLHELCLIFLENFGLRLTIGSAAMNELKEYHSFERLLPEQDADIRSNFYFGGRVQCFKKGIINKPLKIYDVNSMYPFAMRNYMHPVSMPYGESKKICSDTCFVVCEGRNYGAFPIREKLGIRFDVEDGVFAVSIHEWKAAVNLGLFEPRKIIRCLNFRDRSTFKNFVDAFYDERKKATDSGDTTRAKLLKYVLNSSYGKFGQNPTNFFDYKITSHREELISHGWECDEILWDFDIIVWRKKSKNQLLHNIATAASVTGAARAILMEAIANSTNPVYCDTDSLICEELNGVEKDASKLGAWKLEGEGNRAAIGGKKLYAIFDGENCIKLASKGVRLEPSQIVDICNGAVIEYVKESPSYKLSGAHTFIKRKVRMR